MKDENRTKSNLIRELKSLRRRNKRLEIAESKEKKLEKILSESETKYRSLFENSLDAILLTSPDGKILSANPAACHMYGRTEKELCKAGRKELVDLQDPHVAELLKKISRTGKASGEFYQNRKDGTCFLTEVISAVFDAPDGKRTSMIIRDISKRKQAEDALRESEARYKSLFENSIMGISQASPDGRLIYANTPYAQMYGYKNPEEMITLVSDVGQLYANPEAREEVLHILKEKGVMGLREMAVKRRDGSRFFVLVNAREIKDSKGNLLYYQAEHLDITERKRVEEKLIEDESRLSALFDNAGYSISLAKNGVLILGNPAFVKLFGYKDTSEFLGKSFINTIAPKERERIWKYAADREMCGEVPNYYETKGFRRDGSIFDMNVRVSRYIYNNEIYIVGFQSDITERKRVEVSLQNSEAALREAQRVARIGSWHWDAKSDAIWWSDELYRIYEKDPGIPPSTFEKDQKNYTPESAAQLTAAVQKALKTGEPYEIDLELVHNTEPRRWVIARGEVIRNASSQITGLRGTGQDITERKRVEEELHESEEKYRYMFANNPQPMWIYDLETLKFLEINSAALEHYGYSREEFLSMTLKDIRPKEDIDALLKDVELTTKGYNPAGEWRHLKKSGEIINVEIISHIVTFKDRKARHVMVNDITERKQAEQEISKSHNEFRMLANHLQNIREEERTRMAREFHDQLGQSMTALKMDLSLLLRMISDEKQEVQRNLLADELRSMQKLVDETINMIWVIIAGLRPQMLEDLGLVTTLEWEAKQFESRTGISCEFKSSAGDIQMDSNKAIALFRIYQEALTNVARHANATVVKSVLKREHEMLVLEIKDNGCGISRDKKSKPESFGLIGMRERAIAFGGSVEISGIAGEGTTVIVRLPLEQVDAQESISK